MIRNHLHAAPPGLQEFSNAQNGETDPQGAGYDPTRVNAPGGTGHPSRMLPILQLLLSD